MWVRPGRGESYLDLAEGGKTNVKDSIEKLSLNWGRVKKIPAPTTMMMPIEPGRVLSWVVSMTDQASEPHVISTSSSQ